MTTDWKALAQTTLEGAESGKIPFPEAVRLLREAGFDGYAVDFRRSTHAYYLSDGQAIELRSERAPLQVAESFDAEIVKQAIREAQALIPGYTYQGFCAKVAAAGCAGYIVSILGKRVLYYGRTGETHTEYFPGSEKRP